MYQSSKNMKQIVPAIIDTLERAAFKYHDEFEEERKEYQHHSIPKKPSRFRRIGSNINFNIRKFTNHRVIGEGIQAVSKRKFNINPEV